MPPKRNATEMLSTQDALKALPRDYRGVRGRPQEDSISGAAAAPKRARRKRPEVSQEALLEGLEADLADFEGDVESILGRSVNLEDDEEDLEDEDDADDEEVPSTAKKARAAKTDKVKKPTQKQLRKVASDASAKLRGQDDTNSGKPVKAEGPDPNLNTFYRKMPVGKALYATMEKMMSQGLLVEGGDTAILSKFDEAAQSILASSEQTLALPSRRTRGRGKSRGRKVTVEGDLVSYNNWRNNWALEAENVVYRLGDEVLRAEKGCVSMFVKASDSKPSSGGRLGRKRGNAK